MSYTLQGIIHKIDITTHVTDKFRKRDFVIETSEESSGKTFTEYIKFQAIQDKCELLDEINEGDTVKVHFNIKGKKWEKDGKTSYFINLDAWKIEVIDKYDESSNVPDVQAANPPQEEESDLPF